MAFPSITAFSTYEGAAATSHDIPYPAGTVTGDLVFLAVASAVHLFTRSPTAYSNWLRGSGNHQIQEIFLVCAGEDHMTATWSPAASISLAAIACRMTPSGGMTDWITNEATGESPKYVESTSGGTPATINPPTIEYDDFYWSTGSSTVTAKWWEAVVLDDGGGGDLTFPSDPSGWESVAEVDDVNAISLRMRLYHHDEDAASVTFPGLVVGTDRYIAGGSLTAFYPRETADVSPGDGFWG